MVSGREDISAPDFAIPYGILGSISASTPPLSACFLNLDTYEEWHRFSTYSNWLVPGAVMVGRYELPCGMQSMRGPALWPPYLRASVHGMQSTMHHGHMIRDAGCGMVYFTPMRGHGIEETATVRAEAPPRRMGMSA